MAARGTCLEASAFNAKAPRRAPSAHHFRRETHAYGERRDRLRVSRRGSTDIKRFSAGFVMLREVERRGRSAQRSSEPADLGRAGVLMEPAAESVPLTRPAMPSAAAGAGGSNTPFTDVSPSIETMTIAAVPIGATLD